MSTETDECATSNDALVLVFFSSIRLAQLFKQRVSGGELVEVCKARFGRCRL